MIMLRKRLLAACVVAAGVGWVSPVVFAQGQAPAGQDDRVVEVFRLEHAACWSLVETLRPLNFGVSIAVDESANAVILHGDPREIGKLAPLIAELDTTAAGESWKSAIIEVRHRGVEEVADLVRTAAEGISPLRVSAAPSDQMLLVTGSPEGVAAAEELVSRIDKPVPSVAMSFFFVRGTVGGAEVSPVSKDLPAGLRDVAKALGESGVGGVSLLAPLSTRSSEGAEFRAGGYLDAPDGRGLQFSVEGMVHRSDRTDETCRLTLRGRVSQTAKGKRTIFDIETTLAVKLGDYVVLASAPGKSEHGDILALIVRVTPG
jgi:Bacterial type II/III secretion system short domain